MQTRDVAARSGPRDPLSDADLRHRYGKTQRSIARWRTAGLLPPHDFYMSDTGFTYRGTLEAHELNQTTPPDRAPLTARLPKPTRKKK
jgi:hypothetical protein